MTKVEVEITTRKGILWAERYTALAELKEKHPDHFMAKFYEPDGWCFKSRRIAFELNLRRTPRKRILDIGCGFGYFVMACREYGHYAIGLDRPDEVIEEAACILGVPYVPHTIEPCVALPSGLANYDLITTFGVNLRHASGELWGQDDYSVLTTEVRDRLLPGGRWVLRPNQTDDPNSPISRLMEHVWWRDVAGPDAYITIDKYQVEIQWPNN